MEKYFFTEGLSRTFSENLKGKISSKNYDIMERNFRNIFLMCFSTGTNKNSFV